MELLVLPRAATVEVFRRWELLLLVVVGEVHPGIVSEALFFDGADPILGTLEEVSVPFRVPAPEYHC